MRPSEIRKIAFVGDYLPRKCGIATFSRDRYASLATADGPVRHGAVVHGHRS